MDIVLAPASGVPIYQQVAAQVAAQILRGELAPGSPLPPIRTVARQLEISVITIKKAWEELERRGFIYGQVGRGTFVAPRQPHEVGDLRREVAAEQMRKDVAFYQNLGLTCAEAVALLQAAYDDPV